VAEGLVEDQARSILDVRQVAGAEVRAHAACLVEHGERCLEVSAVVEGLRQLEGGREIVRPEVARLLI